MQDLWDEEDEILDIEDPACPRCNSTCYERDPEFSAWICDSCGLWLDEECPDDAFS